MTTALAIAPVRKSIRVNVSQAHRLIDVVTAGLEPRWPLHHGIGKMPRKAVVTETRLDGHGTNLPKMAPRRMLARSSLGSLPSAS